MLPKIHVTATDADDAVADRDAVVVRVAKAGAIETKLNNGQTVHSTIASVPAVIDLTNAKWELSVEDWQPVIS